MNDYGFKSSRTAMRHILGLETLVDRRHGALHKFVKYVSSGVKFLQCVDLVAIKEHTICYPAKT